MPQSKEEIIERIQRLIAKLIATNPVGNGLRLIGGFRYRLLNQGPRLSRDIDYHWEGDLELKQAELVETLKRRLLPEVRRGLGYEVDVRPATGQDSESPGLRIVNVAFWLPNTADSRIDIPLEVTRILCLDETTARTASGIVYPTVSDADMIESKVVALFNRRTIEHRDLVDLFLFGDHIRDDAPQRLAGKFAELVLDKNDIQKRLDDFKKHPEFHVKSIAAIITEQLDATAATNIEQAGGAKFVFDQVLDLLTTKLKLGGNET
jgi:hypothetical protein